jgi:hypothetical protein
MNLGIPTPSRYASGLYVAGLICGPGFSHSLGRLLPEGSQTDRNAADSLRTLSSEAFFI